MDLRTYDITLTGETPLLMHWDNIEWSDGMDAWGKDPRNKKFSKPGDDRTPQWRWIGSMYHDGTHVAVPQDNVMRALMEGGSMVLVPGGRSGKTFKSQTQSGLLLTSPYLTLTVNGHQVPFEPFKRLVNDTSVSFADHMALAKQHGFELFVKRVRVGQSKHVRTRPLFQDWTLTGTMQVLDEQLTTDVLKDVLTYAGIYKGLCEWRPGGRTPGPLGRFKAHIELVASVKAA
jgi:hypothetical protein